TPNSFYALRHLSIPVPWGEIRGKAWGPEHGHPVLCLHGWADNCGSFNTLIPFLPKECRYVAVDMPGHGLSSHRPPGVFYSFPAYAADVRRVAESLSWTKFSIMGHSMGESQFSALYPEMVDGIIVLDVFGFVPTDPVLQHYFSSLLGKKQQQSNKEKKRVYTYEKAVERLLAANPTLSERSIQTLLERGLTQVEGGFVFSRDLRVNFKNIERITLEQSLEMQSLIQAPVLLILHSLEDCGIVLTHNVPDQQTAKCCDTVVRVPGSHHVHLDNPEVVAPFICDFLQTKVLSQQVKA
uniref:Serine hydrolase like n=1 Tax=Haplochromis burtoni TaxID=8153 RepID=A0A3Q2V8Q5_HAPBU